MDTQPQKRFRMTVKQRELMTIIIRGFLEKDPVDLDQILDKLTYETTKASLQFSIRALIEHGMVCKGRVRYRRKRNRQTILPTDLGITTFRG